jgi:hypothetical protein
VLNHIRKLREREGRGLLLTGSPGIGTFRHATHWCDLGPWFTRQNLLSLVLTCYFTVGIETGGLVLLRLCLRVHGNCCLEADGGDPRGDLFRRKPQRLTCSRGLRLFARHTLKLAALSRVPRIRRRGFFSEPCSLSQLAEAEQDPDFCS